MGPYAYGPMQFTHAVSYGTGAGLAHGTIVLEQGDNEKFPQEDYYSRRDKFSTTYKTDDSYLIFV